MALGTHPSIPDSFVLMMYRNISKVWNMLFLPWVNRKRKGMRKQVTAEESHQYFREEAATKGRRHHKVASQRVVSGFWP